MAERIYRLLLLLYPPAFRAEFEVQMLEVFRYRRRQAARDGSGAGRFWAGMIADTVRTAWAERRSPTTHIESGGGGMDGWIQDARYAVRRLVRSPGFTLSALAILTFGIGVNAAAFSLVNGLLIQDPPFEEPDRLVEVLQDSDGGEPTSTSYPAYLDIREHTEIFSSVAARSGGFSTLDLDGNIVPVMVDYATSSLFPTLGLVPSRGRWFDASEDVLGGEPVAVMSERFWQNRFASDPDVLGSRVRLNGTAVTVVGIGPTEYDGGYGATAGDFWLSFSAMGEVGGPARSLDRRADHPFRVVARLAPGTTRQAATATMDRLAERLAAEYPEVNRNRRIHVLPMTVIGVDEEAQVMPIAAAIMAIVVLVLLVSAINLANLLLVRGAARMRELGIRFAVGGSRLRLVRVLFGEVLILCLVGGALGLGLARLLLSGLSRMQAAIAGPITMEISMDGTVLGFTLGISILASLLAGLVPAVRSTSSGVSDMLNDRGGKGGGRIGLTGVLVSAQVAVSLVLLVTAGLFIEQVVRTGAADLGFDHERIAVMQVGLGPLDLAYPEWTPAFEGIEERLEALPGVEGVALAMRPPGAMRGTTTLLVGDMVDGRRRPVEVPWNIVGSDYFATMGVGVLHGRVFDERDGPDDPDRAVVNQAMAQAFWGRTDVVGESYRSENNPDNPVEIIGVVENTIVQSPNEAPRPTVHWAAGQGLGSNMYFMVRVAGDPSLLLNSMRSSVREADARIPVLDIGTAESKLGEILRRQQIAGGLLGLIGLFALGLASLGIYSVVAFGVSRRVSEVGIRMALGAARKSVVGLFMRQAAVFIVIGAVVGLALAWPVGQIVGMLLTGGRGLSAPVVAVCLTTLSAAALVATWLPARRAARIDPMNTLREE